MSFQAPRNLIELADVDVGARFMVPGSGRFGRRVAQRAANTTGDQHFLRCELSAVTGPGTESVLLRRGLLVQLAPEPPADPPEGRAA